jgi:energy-coupling factor transporter ATP-binding protein EcfA2
MLLQKRILEWSKTLPPWQCDLLRRLTAGPLDEPGESDVLEILAGAAGAPTPIPLELADLPADEGEHGRVELRTIHDLRNINCLASGQTLSFEPGLNAVFGDNGSGKSGYGRLVRRVTRSGEPEEVLRDVFDPGTSNWPQTAGFTVVVDDAPKPITVDLAGDPPRLLSAMAAFDASRARLFLAKPNVIEHVPRPLRLLRQLSQTQDRLADGLRDRSEQHRAALTSLPVIAVDTAAGRALGEVGRDTDPAALVSLMALSDADTLALADLELSAAAIRTDQSRQLEAAAQAQAAHARAASRTLAEADSQLSLSKVDELIALRQRLDDVNAGERALADRAFADQRLQATGQGPWREMWFAAERFAEASGIGFPSSAADAACPLCQQDLDVPARERLRTFQEFVTSNLRQQAVDLGDQITAAVQRLPDLVLVRGTVEAELRELPAELRVAADAALAVLDARAVAARNAAAGEPARTVNDAVLIDVLTAHAEGQDEVAKRHASLRDDKGQREIMRQLEELNARVALVSARDTIAKHIRDLNVIAGIEAMIAKLNTQRISNKLRELQEAAITERLRKAIEHEVRELDPVASRIEITGQASKGETVIRLKLKEPCREKIGNVLSDGEQRALSLAFFLAEIAVSDERSAIILDDPVSSLDHRRRAYLAERLAEESRRRQVIVFTHDMAFIHLLQEASDEVGVELHGQTLARAFHRVGMVTEELPIKMLGTAKQLRALRHRLKSELAPRYRREDPLFEQEADRWVADLRKAYDQVIEDTVLNGTVRRFSSHVRVRQLYGIKWTPQIAERIDKAMHKASPKAHHEALALHPGAHTPTQLTAMLEELAAIYESMGGKIESSAEGGPPSADTEPIMRVVQPQL